MTPTPGTRTPDDWFDALPDDQQSTARDLRAMILSTAPQISEAMKWDQPCYSLSGLVCYLQTRKAHLTFGLRNGASLPDPTGLLEGTGKDMRHVKLRAQAQTDIAALQDLLRAAIVLDQT